MDDLLKIQLHSLVVERGIYKRQLTRLENKVEGVQMADKAFVKTVKDGLGIALEKFSPVQLKIECMLSGPDADAQLLDELKKQEKEGDEFLLRHSELELSINRMAEGLGTTPEVTPASQADGLASTLMKQTEILELIAQNNSSGATGTRTKLPQLKLPSFDGKYIDWPPFRDAFASAIHENSNLSDSEKMQYLKMSLTGIASEDIAHVSITNENYEPTWKRLNDRYSKKDHLINAYIQDFMEYTQKKVDTASELQAAQRKYRQIIDGLKALGSEGLSLDMWLIYLMKRNMNMEFRREWEKYKDTDKIATTDKFFEFLTKMSDELERAAQTVANAPAKTTAPEQKASAKPGRSGFKSHHTNAANCPECNSAHPLYMCDKFKALSLYERRQKMSQHHLCYNCMRPNHSVAKCTSKSSCQHCGKRHHTLLHPPQTDPVPEAPVQAPAALQTAAKADESPLTTVTSHHSTLHRKALLPTAVVHVKDAYGKNQACRILLDCGGECTMVSEDCAQRLALPRAKARISVQGAAQTTVGYTRGLLKMELASRYDSGKGIAVEAFVLEKVTSMLPSSSVSAAKWGHLTNLELADPNYYMPGKIDLILGAEHAMAVNLPQMIRGKAGEPVGQLTIFGWVVSGPISSPVTSFTSMHTQCNPDDLLKRFFEVENGFLDQQPLLTEEEAMCEKHFSETHTRDDTGRYVVRLPFKRDHAPLGNSSSGALARFQTLERRFSRDPSLRDQYAEFMGEYLSLGHMESVPNPKAKTEDQSYFLPHQAVLRPSSETTKLRVVFDASATTRPNKPSLNSILAIGPTLQDDLLVLLLRFRTHKVAMSADVKKMYRQVVVAEEDRDFQMIYWRPTPQDALQVFRLKTVTYGTSSAPYLAVRVLHQIAMDYKEHHPEACRVITKSFYMDDLICGAASVGEAKALQKEIQEVLLKAHFNLRKWTSNSVEVLEEIPSELRAITPNEVASQSKAISALGLIWLPGTDELAIAIAALPEISTKRELCAATASIYDPLGFVAPVTIKLKIMFQDLWLLKIEWDEKLPIELVSAYNLIQSEFHLIQKLRIPRRTPSHENIIELHGFADASERAYGAVVYAKGINSEGNTEINIVIAKSRVTPLKPVTIPRLELNAAALLAQLITKVREAIDNKEIQVHAWSDSTVVLQWLQEPPRTWNTYVAHRVAFIQESVPPCDWRHVPTTDNPADSVSRGILPSELLEHRLWLRGPEWLPEREKWPADRVIREKATAERSSHAISLVTQKEVLDPLSHLIETTSEYVKIIRYVAYWRRFIRNRRLKPAERQTGSLLVKELREATTCVLRHVQKTAFPEEYKLCRKKEELPKSSKLRKLVPFLDEKGLMRVRGRLANAEVGYAAQHPIILPSDHSFTRKMVYFHHEINQHAGARILINSLRTEYWILGLQNLAKGITRKCVQCVKAKPAAATPLMGDLPAVRVTQQQRAFYMTGCDFAGPIRIRASKLRKAPILKAYIAVFICMATKAMHLEAVSDLSTDAFIAALRRFSARRGIAHTIFCDNGTNFVGASGESREERLHGIRKHRQRVEREMSTTGTQFNFIPAYSPTFGGLWERGVSNVKTHLRRVLGETLLTFEELATVLAQIEACLNSRPICANPFSDIEDLEPLTPGHFLVSHQLNLAPDADLLNINPNRMSRWLQAQRIVQDFWKRWHFEYVATLHERSKWYSKARNFTVGDLVLIKESALKPAFWRMGRIVDVHPGKDDIVRVATVKTTDGIQKRAVNTLAWLPTEDFLSPSRAPEGENVE